MKCDHVKSLITLTSDYIEQLSLYYNHPNYNSRKSTFKHLQRKRNVKSRLEGTSLLQNNSICIVTILIRVIVLFNLDSMLFQSISKSAISIFKKLNTLSTTAHPNDFLPIRSFVRFEAINGREKKRGERHSINLRKIALLQMATMAPISFATSILLVLSIWIHLFSPFFVSSPSLFTSSFLNLLHFTFHVLSSFYLYLSLYLSLVSSSLTVVFSKFPIPNSILYLSLCMNITSFIFSYFHLPDLYFSFFFSLFLSLMSLYGSISSTFNK